MRVLVEQTGDCTEKWLKNLELCGAIKVHLLMGGEETEAWDIYPSDRPRAAVPRSCRSRGIRTRIWVG
jgi:hypothetical protein